MHCELAPIEYSRVQAARMKYGVSRRAPGAGGQEPTPSFALPDLIVTATAEQHGVTVLHYDADYDRIAEITAQPVEWVAAKGSL